MIVCLTIGFFVTFLGGLGIFVTAKGAVHEIEGLLLLLMATIFFSSLGLIQMLDKLKKGIEQLDKHD